MSKSSDDALQIVEQILPYFQPEYTVTMGEVPELDIIRDVPIVLNSISYEDDYEGDFASRRSVIYTLSFTAKYYLYKPSNVYKCYSYCTGYDGMQAHCQCTNKRTEIYSYPNPSTYTAQEFRSDDDNFGFNETTSFFEDVKNYNPVTESR